MPDMYSTDGTANLRADPKTFDGVDKDPPGGGGKDCGGTQNLKETTTVKTGSTKETTVYSKDARPAGVRSFGGGV